MNTLARTVARPLAGAIIGIFAFAHAAHADLITFSFQGSFQQAGSLFAVGDTFSGSYTFDAGVATTAHPDPSLDIQAQTISAALPGTGWSVDVSSSTVGLFSVSGDFGTISVGNDNGFGDRYVATLAGASPLPLGMTLALFQLDFQDPLSTGADMLSAVSLAALPDIGLANLRGGRFFTSNDPLEGACSQCAITTDVLTGPASSATPLPAPGALMLLAVGLVGVAGASTRRT